MSAVLTRKNTFIALALTLVLISLVAGVLYFGPRDVSSSEISYWPALTMVYEMDGLGFNGQTTRETHHLEYRSVSDWTDTVIESTPFESLALGTVSTAGSYQRLKGKKVEFYDSITDDVSVDKRTDESIYVPNTHLIPIDFFVANPTRAPDGTPYTETTTTTTVCYRSECEENVSGLAFKWGGRLERIALDDKRWGINLKSGNSFIVRELILDASKN